MMTKIKSCKRISFFILIPGLIFLTMMCTKTLYEDELQGLSEIEIPVPATRMPDGSLRQARPAEDPEIFFIVEEMPDFLGGGQEAFRKFIAENLKYPETAKENGIEGRVFIQFVVKADGRVSDASIVRGADPSLDQEALRVVLSSPDWTPGRQRGQAVDVAFTFPVTFRLKNEGGNE
jgi:TonB family protein